jgi:hypothetical protein
VGALRRKLGHAFAVDEPGASEPTPEQRVPVDWFCRQVAKRHLATPGMIALELSRPLNFLASQVMHFFSPAVWALARRGSHEEYKHFAVFLEKRGSIDYLLRRIEEIEAELDPKEKRPATEDEEASRGAS